MTYLINPKWFYWTQVCDNLTSAARFFIIGAIVMVVVCIVGLFLCEKHEEYARTKLKKGLKVFIIIFCIMLPPAIFVPDRNTMKEMAIASYATKENYDAVKGEGKKLIDYIFEKVEENKEK